MWEVKTFKTSEAMAAWLAKKRGIEYTEVFINNGWAVEWRKLKPIRNAR